MKLVIDIEDYDREWIANGYHIPDEINRKIAETIIDGTLLPEHHGRLIDADAMQKYQIDTFGQRLLVIDTAPTIIEADKCTYKETGCGSCKKQLDCPIEAEGSDSE